MSCSLIKHCVIGNLKTLKQILFPEEKTEQEILQGINVFDFLINFFIHILFYIK